VLKDKEFAMSIRNAELNVQGTFELLVESLEEEVNFIINYDIKYRMEREAKEDIHERWEGVSGPGA